VNFLFDVIRALLFLVVEVMFVNDDVTQCEVLSSFRFSRRANGTEWQCTRIHILRFSKFKKRVFCVYFKMTCQKTYTYRMITTLAFTVRSETTNNYIYIQHYVKLLIKIWP